MINRDYILNSIKSNKAKFEKLGVRHVGLFGSYSRNEQTNESDIDILIDFTPEHENFDNYMAACNLIETLFHSKKVEIVTKNGLSPFIGPKILKEVVYV